METVILVDIDGVLSRDCNELLMALYNVHLCLGIDVVQLKGLSLTEFHALPESLAHREQVGAERYRFQTEMLRFDPRHIARCHVIDGAVEAVQELATMIADTEIGYCTARYIPFHERWNDDLARTTENWLKSQGFPCTDQIVFCNGVRAKLEAIVAHLREQPDGQVMLIDDSVDLLLNAYQELSGDDQELLIQGLVLVAFGYDGGNPHPVRIVPLVDWSDIHTILPLIREKEKDYAFVRQKK